MPLTAAEKSKRYRERLKKYHSDKYNEIKKKASERATLAYRRKVAAMTAEQKEELRGKWRENSNKIRNNSLAEQPTTSASQMDPLLKIASFNKTTERNMQVQQHSQQKTPLTAAEKSKRYRERLKKYNSDKYNEIKKKASERATLAYRRKVAAMTAEQKEELRRKWRENSNKIRNNHLAGQPTNTSQNDPLLEITSFNKPTERNVQRRSQQNLEKEDTTLHSEMQNLKKGFNNLLRQMRNQKQKLTKINKNTEEILKKLQKISVADDPPDQSDTGDDLSMYLKIPKKNTNPTKTTADSAEQNTDKDADQRHEGFSCNNCSNNIIGYRYTCVQCPNYDLCASCEAKGAHCLHYVLRIPKPAPHAEVQSMLTAIRSHLLYGADPEPEVEVPVEEPIETEDKLTISKISHAGMTCEDQNYAVHTYITIKVEIKEEMPDPLESDQAFVTDENYTIYSQETKKEITATEETTHVPQIPYNTAIIQDPLLSEPESKRRRVNSPPPLVPVSARVAPGPAHLTPTSARLAPTSAHLASTSAHLAPTSAHLVPDLAPGRMLDNIILYPQREEPAAVEDKEESSFQVFSHVKKKPSKLQAKPGQRGGKALASTSRSDDKK